MVKNKKLIILSHCVLNEYSKVKRWDKDEEVNELGTIDFLKILMENDIGIIQLPCPETTCYGLRRWGHVKDQFDNPHYRKMCIKLFDPFLDQILEYESNGFEVIGIVGIYGSPTCGVYKTCTGDWGGEIGSNPDLKSTLNTISSTDSSGILIEEIRKILEENNLDIPLIDFNKENIELTIEEIQDLI